MAPNAEGELPRGVIERVVRVDALGMRECFQAGLRKDRRLRGTVATRFVIGRDGRVMSAADATRENGPAFPDPLVAACVVGRFRRLVFPAPEGGKVTVVYPLTFSPD